MVEFAEKHKISLVDWLLKKSMHNIEKTGSIKYMYMYMPFIFVHKIEKVHLKEILQIIYK